MKAGKFLRWCAALAGCLLAGCVALTPTRLPETVSPTATSAPPGPTPTLGPKLIAFDSRVQEVVFTSTGGAQLAGQIDWPLNVAEPPLVVIIHHAGREPRDSYQHYAAKLVPAGYAVFRFDKRGAGKSGGEYGCCEADDALAAYAAAAAQPGYDPARVFIIAQSLGTRILAERFTEFERAHPITGVLLLSSLLAGEAVLSVRAPVHIIVADSEPNVRAITEDAVRAHTAAYSFGASYHIADKAEHTLYDISAGPMDWSDPNWPDRFHAGAWESLRMWLEARSR
jgi:alpha/beta superfamily hydrolase